MVELLALVFIWPFLILTIGLIIIVGLTGVFSSFFLILLPILLIPIVSFLGGKNVSTLQDNLIQTRRSVITLSIAVLLPLFAHYVLSFLNYSLIAMLAGLVFGFFLVVSAIFIRGNKVLTLSNGIGGALVLLYMYSKLWELGPEARVIAAAFGLVVAVAISFIKFRDKLS